MREHRHGIVSVAAAASVVVSGAAAAQPYGPGGMYHWGGGFFPFGMVIWPVILIAIVLLAVWAVRSRMPHVAAGTPQRSPGLQVLEERYARGEIGRDEYLQKKADIGG